MNTASFNAGYRSLRHPERATIGLMTPDSPQPGPWRHTARLAERQGFAALWTRDVPLMIPQGPAQQAVSLDDPFAWLAWLAAATENIALGTAAAVLPLRHPNHLAKSALSVDRLSGGRFILGLGSGDRQEEFASFNQDRAQRATDFREKWPLLRSALGVTSSERELFRQSTGGYPVLHPPEQRIGQLVIGSSRQTLQWIARHAEGWATYYRPSQVQRGRFELWRQAQQQVHGDAGRLLLIQSMQLQLEQDPSAPARELPLGLRGGARAISAYFAQAHALGVDHLILNIVPGPRPLDEVIQQLGEEVLAQF